MLPRACASWPTAGAPDGCWRPGAAGYNRRNLALAWTAVVEAFVAAARPA